MKGEQARRSRATNLLLQLRIPPDVIDIERDAKRTGGRRVARRGDARADPFQLPLSTPLLETLTEVLRRGQKAKVFRGGVDPMQLYISIAALGYFSCSNSRSLSVIFASDLASTAGMKRREEHVIEVVMRYLGK